MFVNDFTVNLVVLLLFLVNSKSSHVSRNVTGLSECSSSLVLDNALVPPCS